MKGLKTNLILLVLLGVIFLIFLWDREATKEQEEIEEREQQLTLLETDEVNEVTVVNRLENIVARKEGENWRIIEPIDFPGDNSAWNSLVRSIAGGTRQRVLASDPENLEPYGLHEPNVEVTFKGTKQEEGVEEEAAAAAEEIVSTIAFGNKTPTSSGRHYALIKNTSDVVTIMTSVFNAANKTLFDFRDKTVLSLESDQVQKINIAHDQLDVSLQKSEGDWTLVEPVIARANSTMIDDLVNQISNSKVKQFIEEDLKSENLEAYGLVDPATKLTFWSGEATNEASWASKALLLGATNPSGYTYAKRVAQNDVFAVAMTDLNKIPTSIDALRLKNITSIKSWELQRIQISSSDLVFEASKSEGDWILQQPKEGTANYNDVSSLNREVVGLEVDEFINELPEGTNFETPAITFTLETDVDTETIVFAAPSGVDSYIGKRENPVEYFKIERSKLDSILLDASAVQLEEQEDPTASMEAVPEESVDQEEEKTAVEPAFPDEVAPIESNTTEERAEEVQSASPEDMTLQEKTMPQTEKPDTETVTPEETTADIESATPKEQVKIDESVPQEEQNATETGASEEAAAVESATPEVPGEDSK